MDKLRLSAIEKLQMVLEIQLRLLPKLGKAQACLTACMDVSGFATSTVQCRGYAQLCKGPGMQ